MAKRFIIRAYIRKGFFKNWESFDQRLQEASNWPERLMSVDWFSESQDQQYVLLTLKQDYLPKEDDLPIVIYLLSDEDNGYTIEYLTGKGRPQFRVALVAGEISDNLSSVFDLCIAYDDKQPLHSILTLIGSCYITHCQKNNMTLNTRSGIRVWALPDWQGKYPILDSSDFANACTDLMNLPIIQKNLEAMTKDPRYLWNFGSDQFLYLCRAAVFNKQFEVLCLLLSWLQNTGLELPAPTPLALVNQVEDEIEQEINQHIQRYELSESKLQQIKDFNLKEAEEAFKAWQPTQTISYTAKFKDELLKSIEANDVEKAQNLLKFLTDNPWFVNSYGRFLSPQLRGYINYCIENKQINMLFLLVASLTHFSHFAGKYELLMDVNNLYQYYQNILKKHRARLNYTKEDYQRLSKLWTDSIYVADNPRLDPVIKPLEQDPWEKTNGILGLSHYGSLIQRLGRFMSSIHSHRQLTFSPIPANVQLADFRGLYTIGQPYQRIERFKTIILTEANFAESLVYRSLVRAVDEDNSRQVEACLAAFRRNHIAPALVLGYKNPLADDRTTYHQRIYEPVIGRIFSHYSFNVLLLLAQQADILPLLQHHIQTHALIRHSISGRTQQLRKIAGLYYMLLTEPAQAINMLSQAEFSYLRHHDDLYPNKLFYNHEYRKIISALDECLQHILNESNMSILMKKPSILAEVAASVRYLSPRSRLLGQLYLPLAEVEANTIRQSLSVISRPGSENPSSHLVNQRLKYILPLFDFERVYALHGLDSKVIYYLRLYPHGMLASSRNNKFSVPQSNGSKGVIVHSGRRIDLKYPTANNTEADAAIAEKLKAMSGRLYDTTPKYPKQVPFVRVQNKPRFFLPIGHLTHGFWGSYKEYGTARLQTSGQHRDYQAIVVGSCMIGTTLYADQCDVNNQVVATIKLTDPKQIIPQGFRASQLRTMEFPHPYEAYMLAQLKEMMPFLQACLAENGTIYYDLPTPNYIMYGMRYYLHGVFDKEQFIHYVGIILERHEKLCEAILSIAAISSVKLQTRSTLDTLGIATKLSSNDLISLMEQVATGDSPEEKEQSLTTYFMQQMTQCDNPYQIGVVYGSLDKMNWPKKLVDLNQLDYGALNAVIKLSHPNPDGSCEHNVLGVMPQDEEQIFTSYETHFADQFGALDTILWLPTMLPQNENPKKSKLFFIEEESVYLNELITKNWVGLQSLLIYMIAKDDVQGYFDIYFKMKEILESMEEKYQTPTPTHFL